MKFHIKGTNMNVTSEIADYLQKKIDMLDKFIDSNDTSILCEVEIGRTTTRHKSGDIFRTEINIRLDGKQFRAVAEDVTPLSSIDDAKDEMARELSNYKSRQLTMLRRGGAAIKNLLRAAGSGIGHVGSGIGSGIGSVGSGIGSGFEMGYKQLKRLNWRKKRRD